MTGTCQCFRSPATVHLLKPPLICQCHVSQRAAVYSGMTSFFPLKPFAWMSSALCKDWIPPSIFSIAGLGTNVLSCKDFASHSLNSHRPNSLSTQILAANVCTISTPAGFLASSGYGSVRHNLPPPNASRISAHFGALPCSEMASYAATACWFEAFKDCVISLTTVEEL